MRCQPDTTPRMRLPAARHSEPYWVRAPRPPRGVQYATAPSVQRMRLPAARHLEPYWVRAPRPPRVVQYVTALSVVDADAKNISAVLACCTCGGGWVVDKPDDGNVGFNSTDSNYTGVQEMVTDQDSVDELET